MLMGAMFKTSPNIYNLNSAIQTKIAEARAAAGVIAVAAGVGLLLGAGVALASPLYVAAGLAGVAGLLLALASPFWALIGVFAATLGLPFAVIPVELGPIRLTIVDVALVLATLSWAFRLLATRVDLASSHADGPVLLYVGITIIAFLLGTSYTTTAEVYRLFLKSINAALVFFAIVQSVNTVAIFRRTTRLFSLIGWGAATIGVVLYFLPHPTSIQILSALRVFNYPSGAGALRFIAGADIQRAIGLAVDPNVFGAMLVLVALVTIGALFDADTKLKPLVLSGLVVSLLALLLTYSRSSWLGFAGGLALFVALWTRRPWLLLMVGAGLIAALLLPSELPFVEHLQSGLQARDQAAAMRLGEYKDALILIQRYPIFGVGYGSAPTVDLYLGVSSIYLLIAEQAGVVGLTAFLIVVVAVALKAARPAWHHLPVPGRSVFLGWLSAMVGALTAGGLDHHFANIVFPHMITLWWLVVGMVVAGSMISDSARKGDQSG